ncbi:hypothetical protein DPMN_183467 [Dreissena polymorpha]|uniref:Uncharacterized protein n=1 Tax=Dreissena polymorpha TaxID=45954 RepID=A0A9D4DHG9_DREPO|nr:hypothetical protein DPMN_183467 [Dreissena polymorpha]
MLGKACVFHVFKVLDKLAEQQKSNKMLEEGMALMDKALRLSKTPDLLRMRIAEKLGDRQAFRGYCVV